MNQFDKLEYDLADMRSANGQSLRWHIEELSSQTALKISQDLRSTGAMITLSSLVPDLFSDLYFQRRIKQEIYPIIRSMCVIDWHIRNNSPLKKTYVRIPTQHGLVDLLKKHWPSPTIHLRLDSKLDFRYLIHQKVDFVYNQVRQCVKRLIRTLLRNYRLTDPPNMPEHSIAIHYSEGIDENSRSDLFWYRQSGIAPERILVFFDSFNSDSSGTRKPIDSDTIRIIEEKNMQWVCLERLKTSSALVPYWDKTHVNQELCNTFNKISSGLPRSLLDKWIHNTSQSLLREVDYWQSFYSFFNIKLHIESEEGTDRGVAQRIAMDNIDGIHIGKQRSENLGWHNAALGYHPHHVFFMWGNRSIGDLINSHNHIAQIIIAGYPFDYLFSEVQLSTEWRRSLTDNDASFCIALFDEVFGPNIHYSRTMLIDFYNSFLNLVINNPDIGVIIKSKKPGILEELYEIQPTLTKALQTKRCLIVDNPQKRLPVAASNAADISVGVGISSAVTEAVISGSRGLHYDCSQMLSHPFHDSGRNQFIFNNLNNLIDAINKYKNAAGSENETGKFSTILDQLDPFRDGKAYHRIEKYVADLLDSFEHGAKQMEALDIANTRYASLWGSDKVISE